MLNPPRSLFVVLVLAAGCARKPAEVLSVPPTATEVSSVPAKPAVPAGVQQILDNFARVHFAYDSATLTSTAKQALDDNVALLQKHADVRVEIEGHCDERGTIEYNLALGDRRAHAVRDYLALRGVDARRLTPRSYGEERPVARGASETAWSTNRRAEFTVTWGGGVASSSSASLPGA